MFLHNSITWHGIRYYCVVEIKSICLMLIHFRLNKIFDFVCTERHTKNAICRLFVVYSLVDFWLRSKVTLWIDIAVSLLLHKERKITALVVWFSRNSCFVRCKQNVAEQMFIGSLIQMTLSHTLILLLIPFSSGGSYNSQDHKFHELSIFCFRFSYIIEVVLDCIDLIAVSYVRQKRRTRIYALWTHICVAL